MVVLSFWLDTFFSIPSWIRSVTMTTTTVVSSFSIGYFAKLTHFFSIREQSILYLLDSMCVLLCTCEHMRRVMIGKLLEQYQVHNYTLSRHWCKYIRLYVSEVDNRYKVLHKPLSLSTSLSPSLPPSLPPFLSLLLSPSFSLPPLPSLPLLPPLSPLSLLVLILIHQSVSNSTMFYFSCY